MPQWCLRQSVEGKNLTIVNLNQLLSRYTENGRNFEDFEKKKREKGQKRRDTQVLFINKYAAKQYDIKQVVIW